MNDKEKAIYESLVKDPSEAFLDYTTNTIYVLVPGGMVEVWSRKPLSDLTDEEANNLIVNSMRKLQENV